MATRTIRADTAITLQTIAKPVISPVPFTLGFPRDIEREHVYLGRTIGDMSPLHMSGPTRAHRKDDWTITVEVQAANPGQTDAEAYTRAAEIFGLIEDTVAGNQNLSNLDGLLVLKITRVDGPNTVGTDEGFVGFLSFEVASVATLT